MKYKVDNAIITAAGLASRFAPISQETHKALIKVNGEVIIERKIRQLQAAGIKEIIVTVGYMKEKFYYLAEKFGVIIIENNEYATRNNSSSIYVAKDYIKNSYICAADDYFPENPFNAEEEESFYSVIYEDKATDEWYVETDSEDFITKVTIGGEKGWYMIGHVFWSESFSKKMLEILESEYHKKETYQKYWETLYIEHLDVLHMKTKCYDSDEIYEFDTLDELREYDKQYQNNSNSPIMESLALRLNCKEQDMSKFIPVKNEQGEAIGCTFSCHDECYRYRYDDQSIMKM
jgi:CTP:phosphocholine cytidylyltransferase involved in choline phosphorylation for cell surface LPS epitopes